MDRADRSANILAQGDERTQDPGGVADVLIAVSMGSRLPEAIGTFFRRQRFRPASFHLIRNSVPSCHGWSARNHADIKVSLGPKRPTIGAAARWGEFEAYGAPAIRRHARRGGGGLGRQWCRVCVSDGDPKMNLRRTPWKACTQLA
jgi:hypothetical protein